MHPGLIHIAASDTVASTLVDTEHDLRAIGAVAGTYFLTPAFHSQVGKRTVVAHFGFSDDMTPVQRATVERFRQAGIVDGISVPLYGPNGRDSYSAFLFDRPLGPEDEPLVTRLVQTARHQHHKICLLIERDYKTPVAISKRESEVLYWMARGKSNTDVATILGVTPGTIDTFVRRIYAKFNVHDRISAILEGMSRGLLKLG